MLPSCKCARPFPLGLDSMFQKSYNMRVSKDNYSGYYSKTQNWFSYLRALTVQNFACLFTLTFFVCAELCACLCITGRVVADRYHTVARQLKIHHRTHFCGTAGSFKTKTKNKDQWYSTKKHPNSRTSLKLKFACWQVIPYPLNYKLTHVNTCTQCQAKTHINSVSLICQGRKPSVLSTGPNFTTSSGSGMFFFSETSKNKDMMLSKWSYCAKFSGSSSIHSKLTWGCFVNWWNKFTGK